MKTPYASITRRMLAFVVDLIPLSIISFFVFVVLGDFPTFVSVSDGQTRIGVAAGIDATTALMLWLFFAFYYVGMEMTFGGTIGKLMTGLRVRNANGSPLSFRGALCRFILRIIDGMIFYLPAIICIASTTKNQRLGDVVGSSIVCYKEALAPTPTIVYTEQRGWQSQY